MFWIVILCNQMLLSSLIASPNRNSFNYKSVYQKKIENVIMVICNNFPTIYKLLLEKLTQIKIIDTCAKASIFHMYFLNILLQGRLKKWPQSVTFHINQLQTLFQI